MNDIAAIKKFLEDNVSKVFSKLNIDCDNHNGVGPINCKCPIHDGDNDRSFSYYKNGRWVCWTHNCHEEYGNDILGLIKGVISKNGKKTFSDVLRWVKNEFNLKSNYNYVEKPDIVEDFMEELNSKTGSKTIVEDEPDRYFKDVDIPSNYFVKRRFYNAETMKFFDIGDSKLNYGISKYRSVIPVHDSSGSKVIANLYRSNVDWLSPKFLIDPNFKKGNYLYNHHRAEKIAREKNTMFLVEGSGDVWRMYEAGVMNCVSVMGKEVTENQRIRLDNMSIINLIVLLDNDTPGRDSKIGIVRNLSRFYNLIFPIYPYKRDIGKMSPSQIKDSILTNLKGYY